MGTLKYLQLVFWTEENIKEVIGITSRGDMTCIEKKIQIQEEDDKEADIDDEHN